MRWPDDPAGWLAQPALLAAWVATLDGQLMGHVALSRAGTEDAAAVFGECAAMVSRLFVSPAVRGHGTGTVLLQQAVREARQLGLRPVLEVVAASSSAVAFYERLGWRLVGSTHHLWGPGPVIVRQYAAPD
jgi:GNAT superfamily N-acetyltransferase